MNLTKYWESWPIILPSSMIDWIIQSVALLQWRWNELCLASCFLMGMLTIDKLFICIKCNNSSLLFLLFGNIWNFWRKQYRLLSHVKTKAVMDKKLYCWTKAQNCLQWHLSACLTIFIILCIMWFHPVFFLLSKVSENQSLLMEWHLICPFLYFSTYPCSHCEFTSFYWNEPGEEVN